MNDIDFSETNGHGRIRDSRLLSEKVNWFISLSKPKIQKEFNFGSNKIVLPNVRVSYTKEDVNVVIVVLATYFI